MCFDTQIHWMSNVSSLQEERTVEASGLEPSQTSLYSVSSFNRPWFAIIYMLFCYNKINFVLFFFQVPNRFCWYFKEFSFKSFCCLNMKLQLMFISWWLRDSRKPFAHLQSELSVCLSLSHSPGVLPEKLATFAYSDFEFCVINSARLPDIFGLLLSAVCSLKNLQAVSWSLQSSWFVYFSSSVISMSGNSCSRYFYLLKSWLRWRIILVILPGIRGFIDYEGLCFILAPCVTSCVAFS